MAETMPGGIGGSGSIGANVGVRPLGGAMPADPPAPKIQFDRQGMGKKGEALWKRQPNKDGTGATHCKVFHARLGDESLTYLETQVNEWLDAHPDYEVKLVQMSVGEWSGKLGKEQHIIAMVWV